MHEGKKIDEGEYPIYAQELQELFHVVERKDLKNLPGLELFAGMLVLIRSHNMKLEGEFATLLTNMLVLEGMAKNIYSEINLLKIALPYFSRLELPQLIEEELPGSY